VADGLNHQWVGLLSSYSAVETAADHTIDYLFIISGYLQQQKESFIDVLLTQAKKLPGHKVFILGDTSGREVIRMEEENITIYPVAVGSSRNNLFNQAELIISRSGYTTVLDLAEMDKPAVLIATPRQTEQEYLADFLGDRGWYATSHEQRTLDVQALLARAKESPPFTPPWKTRQSLQIIEETVAAYLPRYRFSIVVPAHNEEQYLENTLLSLTGQEYPGELYEVIVVDNGSDDATPEICSRFADQYDNISCLSCEQGVSRARNSGFSRTDPSTDWIIFLDADTLLEKTFLSELNRYLGKRHAADLAVGTTAVRPADDRSPRARFWFKLYDLGHRLTRTSFSLQIVRRQVAEKIEYDEQLSYAEDLHYLTAARRHGSFFFLRTKAVSSSTRRFRRQGYLKQTLLWLYQALQPARMQKKRSYEVIR
jgi:hypothetical protein